MRFINDARRKVLSFLPSDECVHYAFLHAFVARLSDAAAVQVWPSFQSFVKDISAAPQLHKYRLLPTLRLFSSLGDKIAATSALEDKRMRRDIHVRPQPFLSDWFNELMMARCCRTLS